MTRRHVHRVRRAHDPSQRHAVDHAGQTPSGAGHTGGDRDAHRDPADDVHHGQLLRGGQRRRGALGERVDHFRHPAHDGGEEQAGGQRILPGQHPVLHDRRHQPDSRRSDQNHQADGLGLVGHELPTRDDGLGGAQARQHGVADAHLQHAEQRAGDRGQDAVGGELAQGKHMGQDQPLELDQQQAGGLHPRIGERLTQGELDRAVRLAGALPEQHGPAPDGRGKPAERHDQDRQPCLADAGYGGDDRAQEQDEVGALQQGERNDVALLALKLGRRHHHQPTDDGGDEDHGRLKRGGVVAQRADQREHHRRTGRRDEHPAEEPGTGLQVTSIDDAVDPGRGEGEPHHHQREDQRHHGVFGWGQDSGEDQVRDREPRPGTRIYHRTSNRRRGPDPPHTRAPTRAARAPIMASTMA